MITRRGLLTGAVVGGLSAAATPLLPLFTGVAAQPGPYGDPRVFILNTQTLAMIRDRIAACDPQVMPALKTRTAYATRQLGNPPVSVVQKDSTPPSGDTHDYFSIGRYYWPDPTKPDGLPWINRDGETNPDVVSLPDQANLAHLITWVDAFSHAYTFTGDERFATQACTFLRTWFLAADTRMNPNLNYAASFPGRADGQPSGMIDTALFGRLIDNIGLIEQSPAWSEDDAADMRDWMGTYLDWALTSPFGIKEGQAANNHSTWYDVQVVAMARFVGRDDLARQILQDSVGKRIATQIEPDGRQPQELKRTTALHYSVYNLTAFCNLASLAANMNIDLWNAQTADGRGVRKALDFVLPYLLGQRAWPYQQISTFDRAELSIPLRQAATAYGEGSYWDTAEQLEGVDTMKSLGNLLFVRP